MIYKKNPYITKCVNVKSKWRSNKKCTVSLSWHQVHTYNQSFQKMRDETTFIPPDALCWYKWLKQKGKRHLVSHYLHEKHKKQQDELEERRIKRMRRKNKHMYNRERIGRMFKQDLSFHDKQRNINVSKNVTTISKQRKCILKTLSERDLSKLENDQMCFNCKTKKAMKEHKCMK